MELTVLGSGNYQPLKVDRHFPAYLVKIGKQNLVFDFSRGCLDQLLKLGVKYYDIDTIFISHAHADHCSELSSFLHIALAEPGIGKFRKKDITIYGPKGIQQTINHLLRAFHLFEHKPVYKVKVKELKDHSIVRGSNWTLQSHAVKHSPNMTCLAYCLKSKNKILTYSGDTEDCSGLRRAAKNADLLLIEAGCPQKFQDRYHMTDESVGQVAEASGVGKVVLTHVAPHYLDNFDMRKGVKKFYKGPVFIAKDLMKFKI